MGYYVQACLRRTPNYRMEFDSIEPLARLSTLNETYPTFKARDRKDNFKSTFIYFSAKLGMLTTRQGERLCSLLLRLPTGDYYTATRDRIRHGNIYSFLSSLLGGEVL